MHDVRWWAWWWGLLPLLAACGAAASATVSDEQRLLAERRLLAPFLADREIGCGELLVEITGNFHACVGQPAVDRTRHEAREHREAGFVEKVWTNPTGLPDAAFVITIGEPAQLGDSGFVPGKKTTFRVVNQVRLRIYEERREMTLNATAGGAFVFVKDGKEAPREVRQFAIADGVLRQS